VIGRRQFLIAGGAASLITAAPPLPATDRLAFQVTRDDSPVGTHVLIFETRDDGFDIHIAVDIAVKFGPFTLFRYTLRGLEQWRGGRFARLDTNTDDDGTADHAMVERDGDALRVSGSKGPAYIAPADAHVATHWNHAELDGPWINPQDGRLMRLAVTPKGSETIRLGDGSSLSARHFALSGEVRMDLWYDAADRWCQLTALAQDGSHLRYHLT
jgi:hypothetical protein